MKTLLVIASLLIGGWIGSNVFTQIETVDFCPQSTIVKAYQDSVASGAVCAPLLTKSLNPGDQNGYVMILQSFLISQGADILSGPTGFYGVQTRAAVNDFQLKYSGSILAPQHLSNPTGAVKSGTLAQINAIHCASLQ